MQQITNNIYQISLGGVNTFIIEDKGLTLIDTGNKNSTDKIFAAIKKVGKSPKVYYGTGGIVFYKSSYY